MLKLSHLDAALGLDRLMKDAAERNALSDSDRVSTVCPHCHQPAFGWHRADLARGWRMETAALKRYHCRAAAVVD